MHLVKITVIFFFIFLIFSSNTIAQDTNSLIEAPAKMVYGELGGPGLFSVNYDQRFKGQKGLGFKVGMGGIGFLNTGIFALPFGLNYLTGSNGHYAEYGLGLSAVTISDGSSLFDAKSANVLGYFTIGYRYQPEKKGFTARVFLSPIFNSAGFFPFYGGISVGFKF